MSDWHIQEVKVERGTVVLRARHWDGVDRPDWIKFGALSPDQARYLARQITTLAEEAEKAAEVELKRQRDDLESKRDALAKQLQEVDAKLAKATPIQPLKGE